MTTARRERDNAAIRAFRKINEGWNNHLKAMMILGLVLAGFCGGMAYSQKADEASSSSTQVNALSTALELQQNEAAKGGTKIITPPTSVIKRDPDSVMSSDRPQQSTSDLQNYVQSLFNQYVASHPSSAVNYSAIHNYVISNISSYLAAHPQPTATGPAGPSGASGSPGPSGASGASATVDYDQINDFINAAITNYFKSNPLPSGSPGAKGDRGEQGEPGPSCASGYKVKEQPQLDGGSIEVCTSAPADPSPSSS